MACTGYGSCKQGRARCRTPLTCSGFDTEQAIEHFRLHRVPARPAEPDTTAEDDAFDRQMRWAQIASLAVAATGMLLILLGAL